MISTNLHLWPFVAEAQRRGAKVVVIDPVRHRTAAHADWYIPIRPGTDGALALGMMNVIIGEGLADEAYVRDYTVGYDELAERVARYTPEWASEQTGIPADDIRTLAREYATSQPSMIRIGVAIERHAGERTDGQTEQLLGALGRQAEMDDVHLNAVLTGGQCGRGRRGRQRLRRGRATRRFRTVREPEHERGREGDRQDHDKNTRPHDAPSRKNAVARSYIARGKLETQRSARRVVSSSPDARRRRGPYRRGRLRVP
jgi:hypothetical protein